MQTDGVKALIDKELQEANQKKPLFVDNHQAYAVILEELHETAEEIIKIDDLQKEMWKAVRNDDSLVRLAGEARDYAINAAQEAIQVAAMCQKAIDSELARIQLVDIELNRFPWSLIGENTESKLYECPRCGKHVEIRHGASCVPSQCPICGATR